MVSSSASTLGSTKNDTQGNLSPPTGGSSGPSKLFLERFGAPKLSPSRKEFQKSKEDLIVQ